jgi:hypothetical protein
MDAFWIILGIVVSILITIVVFNVVGRATTRPIKQNFRPSTEGFYGGAVTGSSNLPCGRVSSEAEQLYALFSSKKLFVGEEGSKNLTDLKNLLSKLTCFKRDLMSPGKTITAIKELGFSTHMDIQQVADLTGRCFSKIVPERDLEIQFIKWRDFGMDVIRRLCTAGNISEAERTHAETLFSAVWKDVQSVAQGECISPPPKDPYVRSRLDPAANTPNQLQNLRPYDGYY